MSNPSTFRAWLKRRRQERGLTQDDLGELVGYAGQTITKIEGGQRRPSPQLALRLAQALQLAPEEQSAWMAAALADAEAQIAAPEAPAPEAPAPPAAETRPLRHPMPSPGLPAYLTPFVGRERERAELAALLGRPDCRLVTVLGPGGVGKTRLASETGRAIDGFADGAAFVSLAPVAAPSLVVPAIGDALGFAFSGAGDLLAQLTAYLGDKRILLILDNLEHLLDPDGLTLGLLEQLLALTPGVSVLATSRERLRLAGEWVLELEGLPVPQPHAPRRAAAPALTLFVEHAERVDRSFRLTPANEATIATICRLVGGLPLGIELAAAWTRLLSLEEIAQELARGLDTAHLSPRTLPARHHSLRAVVDHSWQLLSPEERAALRRLSVFHGGFTREAAAQVAGAHLGVLASLADKSLLRRGAGGRYDLHEIIKQYADALLREDAEELAATRGRHGAYYIRFVGERDERLTGADQAAAMAELGAEIDNIRAAWPWGVAHAPLGELERAGEVLQWFYEFRSWLQEGSQLFERAVEQLRSARAPADDGGRRALGRMLGHYGYLATRVGALAQANAALAESCALLAQVNDTVGMARTLQSQGSAAYWGGDYDQARRLIDACLALTPAAGKNYTRAMARTTGSMIAHATGAHAEAERQFRAALADWRELGNPRGMVWCITACGAVTLMALGRHHEAQELLRESLSLSYATQDAGGTAMTLHNLGRVALQQGELEEAIYFLRETLPLLRPTSSWVATYALNDLGTALWRAGLRPEAQRAYAEALELGLRVNAVYGVLQAMVGLATCLAHAGQHGAALGLATRVLADRASRGELQHVAAELRGMARAHLSAGEAARLEERARPLPLASVPAELVRPAVAP